MATSYSFAVEKSYFALIRHGAYHQPIGVPSAHLPHPLTDEGFAQAQQGADKIKKFLSDHQLHLSKNIHSSNLLRAYQTADIFQKNLGPDNTIEQTPQLCERSVGSMANLTVEQIEEILKKDPRVPTPPKGWKSSAHYCLPVPNAESLFEAGKRVYDYIEKVMQNSSDNSLTLFVGHGASIRYCAHHFGIWELDQVHAHSMFYAEPVFYQWQNKVHVSGDWKVREKTQEAKD